MNNTKRETVRKTIEQSDTILGKCGKFHNGIQSIILSQIWTQNWMFRNEVWQTGSLVGCLIIVLLGSVLLLGTNWFTHLKDAKYLNKFSIHPKLESLEQPARLPVWQTFENKTSIVYFVVFTGSKGIYFEDCLKNFQINDCNAKWKEPNCQVQYLVWFTVHPSLVPDDIMRQREDEVYFCFVPRLIEAK